MAGVDTANFDDSYFKAAEKKQKKQVGGDCSTPSHHTHHTHHTHPPTHPAPNKQTNPCCTSGGREQCQQEQLLLASATLSQGCVTACERRRWLARWLLQGEQQQQQHTVPSLCAWLRPQSNRSAPQPPPPSSHPPTHHVQTEEAFFQEKQEKAALPAEYVANQKAVDAALLGKLRWVVLWQRGGGGGRGAQHPPARWFARRRHLPGLVRRCEAYFVVPAALPLSCAGRVSWLARSLNWGQRRRRQGREKRGASVDTCVRCSPPHLQRRPQGLPVHPLYAALWRPAAPHEVLRRQLQDGCAAGTGQPLRVRAPAEAPQLGFVTHPESSTLRAASRKQPNLERAIERTVWGVGGWVGVGGCVFWGGGHWRRHAAARVSIVVAE